MRLVAWMRQKIPPLAIIQNNSPESNTGLTIYRAILHIGSSNCSGVAQLVEQVTVNHPVAGSSPAT